jgi:hypothetical protein
MIDFCDFGVIVVHGKRYTSDVIVLPERVIEGWWRREGHEICVEDLSDVLNCELKPEVLVVGTGFYGMVKVLLEVENALNSRGITLIAQPTKEACKTFNQLLKSKKCVAGAFHLTC